MNTNTLKPVMFFTDDITLIPHSLSSELADKLEKPLTIREFSESTGAQRVSLYTTEDFELVVRTRLPNGQELFAQGPEQFPVYH